MALLDRLFSGPERVIELDGKVEKLGLATAAPHREVRNLDRRLIRVETALELASDGRFRPRLVKGDEPSGS